MSEEKTKEERKREFQLSMNNYKIGAFKDEELTKYFNWSFQESGDWLSVVNKIGVFTVQATEISRPGLPNDGLTNSVRLDVPKIPGELYNQMLAFFKNICDKMDRAEAFVQFYYDFQEEKYVIHVPEQTVSKASVSYDATKNLCNIDRDRYLFVLEVHSHNDMGAFFSGTDDRDEQDYRFFGVLGKLTSAKHEEKYRFRALGKTYLVDKSIIFEESTPPDLGFPKEWLDKIKKRVYTTQTTRYPVSHYTGSSHKHNASPRHPKYGSYQDDLPFDDPRMTDEDLDYYRGYRGRMDAEDDGFDYGEWDPSFFSLEGIDDQEIRSQFLDELAGELTTIDVRSLIESLVDRGFDSIIQEFIRR